MPGPGWVMIKTPTKPTISADQRCTPTFSFRITIDSSVVNSGAAKPIAVAAPSDSTPTAMNQHSIEPNCDNPRCRCSRYRRVRSTANPAPGRTIATTVRNANSVRRNATSPSG